MKSSTILAKSHNFVDNLKKHYINGAIPDFIKEIPEFGKSIYFLERHPTDKNLIFQTTNIDRWERCKEHIQYIIDILMFTKKPEERIKVDFESIRNINSTRINNNLKKNEFCANILLSGGLDSMCGAYHYVKKLKKKVIFTHVYHKNTPSLQMLRELAEKELNMPLVIIDGMFYNKAKYRNLGEDVKETKMNLNQMRTFFYLCNAVPINYAYGINDIFITENGPLTINPSFSELLEFTNTTNPEFIDFFNQFLENYFGQKNFIKVDLPFRNYTKAELMASLPTDILIKTHSCSRNFNNKKSCFNCYACYIRRFSAYAYKNYRDDIYKTLEEEYQRYSINGEKIFQQNEDFYKQNKNVNLIKQMIDFCCDTLSRERLGTYHRKYPMVYRKYLDIGEENVYYENYWNLLERFSIEILSGIHNFFSRNRSYMIDDYHLWKYFSDKIYDLIEDGIIERNFYDATLNRITIRAKSIVGERTR